jgi:hypothetical protein
MRGLLKDIFEDRDQGVRIILKYMLREQVSGMWAKYN